MAHHRKKSPSHEPNMKQDVKNFLFDFSASKRVGMASHLHGFLIGSTTPTMRLYLLFDSESRGRKKTIESRGVG